MAGQNQVGNQTRLMPWDASRLSIEDFLTTASAGSLTSDWRDNKIQELGAVNITAALIAGVVSAAFSWPTISDAPWTVKAVLYSTLIIALCSVASGTQQTITLNRYGKHPDGLKALQKLLESTQKPGKARPFQLYVWQLPVMLLNISIALLVIGIIILIWARAANSPSWDDDMKIAFVATLASVFALLNYVLGATAINVKRA